jgi:hypothetical protein
MMEQRSLPTRRKADVELVSVLAGLLALTMAAGIAWGTAQAAVNQKVDRGEFSAHVAEMNRRTQVDSLRGAMQEQAFQRIEHKLDSTNTRLSRLICNRQPIYCQ